MSRRALLKRAAWPMVCAPWLGLGNQFLPQSASIETKHPAPPPVRSYFSASDDAFLEELERANFRYFWEQANPETGLVRDRCNVRKPDKSDLASIASTGFGLTALCIGDKRGYVSHAEARGRVVNTLRFLWKTMQDHRGFYFHWANVNTGERLWDSEVSSVDTAILLCGILTCRQHFAYHEIEQLASDIFNRVDWNWLSEDTPILPHGWRPETGFLQYRWDNYSEMMMMYLLGLGSATHPLPPNAWNAWKRSQFEYDGVRYIGSFAPLFVHQYSQAWFDFRGKRDQYADYFQNSIIATEVHRRFCLDLAKTIPRLQRRPVGHHRLGFRERLHCVGRASRDRADRRLGCALRRGGLDSLPAAGNNACFADDKRSLWSAHLERLRLRGRIQSFDELVRHRRGRHRYGNHHGDGGKRPDRFCLGNLHEESRSAARDGTRWVKGVPGPGAADQLTAASTYFFVMRADFQGLNSMTASP